MADIKLTGHRWLGTNLETDKTFKMAWYEHSIKKADELPDELGTEVCCSTVTPTIPRHGIPYRPDVTCDRCGTTKYVSRIAGTTDLYICDNCQKERSKFRRKESLKKLLVEDESKWSLTIDKDRLNKWTKRILYVLIGITIFYSITLIVSFAIDITYENIRTLEFMWYEVALTDIIPDNPKIPDVPWPTTTYWLTIYTSSAPLLSKLIVLIPINLLVWIVIFAGLGVIAGVMSDY